MDWEEMEDILSKSEVSNLQDASLFKHDELSERLKKTFYYAPHKKPAKDTLSFSLTREAVENFRKAAPSSFGKLGHRYASRVARDACISPCSLLLGMIYIERLAHRNPAYLQKISSSDLFLISMMLASKYLQDEGIEDEVFNDEWAASGLLDVDYVNSLEADFLRAIDWRVLVRKPEFQRILFLTEMSVARKHIHDRGWCSYTDLQCFMGSRKITEQILQHLYLSAKAVFACLVLYSGAVIVATGTFLALQSTYLGVRQMQTQRVGMQEFGPTNFIGPKMGDVMKNKSEPVGTLTVDGQHETNAGDRASVELPSLPLNENPEPKPVTATPVNVVTHSPHNTMMTVMETMVFLSNVSVICYDTEEAEQLEICPYCRRPLRNARYQNIKESCHSCSKFRGHDSSGHDFRKQPQTHVKRQEHDYGEMERKNPFPPLSYQQNRFRIYDRFKQPSQITVF